MEISPGELPVQLRYKLLTGLVVPRPIAWVSSQSPDGTPNLAPFSYFSIVGHAPMALSFSVAGRKPDGSEKDTLRNVRFEGGLGEFVVNLVTEEQAALMARTAAPLAFGHSEFDAAGIRPAAGAVVRPPRVVGAPAAFECRTVQIVEVGISRIVIGEVVHIFVADELFDEHKHIRFEVFKAVGRLAGTAYARISDRFELPDEGFFPK